MSSSDNKVVIANDPLFQSIIENQSYRNIHYYAAGAVVYNYFGKKIDEGLHDQIPNDIISNNTQSNQDNGRG